MKYSNPFKRLTKFELFLWLASVTVISVSQLFSTTGGLVSTLTSLIGVTALIFVSKGMVIGQFMLIVFALLYGGVSFGARYYGEVMTYVGMSLPMAVLSTVSWLKHPHKDTEEVEIERISPKKLTAVFLLSIPVTVVFYFILEFFSTASLIISTISVTTSFIAAALTFLRSPYYALGYAVNDIVLIVLWIIAAIKDPSNIAMVFCFVMFLANDIYGFCNWRRMLKRQQTEKSN